MAHAQSAPEAQWEAEKPRPALRVVRCPGLDAQEIERLFGLELSVLSDLHANVSSYVLEIRCEADKAQLTLFDQRASVVLAREVSGAAAGGTERVVALAAAELLMALDWMPEVRPSRGPVGVQTTRPQPIPHVEADPSVARRTAAWDVRAGVGLVARSLSTTPLFLVAATVTSEMRLTQPVTIGITSTLEKGSAARAAGTVSATAASVGLLVGLELPLSSDWAVSGELVLRGMWAKMEGIPANRSFQAASLEGLMPDVFARLGARFSVDRLVVFPYVVGGITVTDWEARVSDEPTVKFGGPWVGGGLEIGFNVGPRN